MRHFDWFLSDTHFGHANIIRYSQRPFTSVGEMNDTLIANFRACVSPTDTVLWLGDVALGPADLLRNVMTQLPGTHVLVRGNHDRSAAAMARAGFAAVAEELVMHVGGRVVRASHHPRPVRAGEVYMHGHTHETKRRVDNRIHVGVDAWDYRPAGYEEIAELVKEI